ncbi:AraC family transcriptional regulator [Paenibacillus qinlingensis]|uniref:AraC-like DNA-binding protein/quercetin dioxygenase-like cupin family protein n=1 Tax=Paenibacillus qinlingensis TaxID=1837343 RepID=A0ABU1NP91_9BACL|nr:AraC family transcriptional regulator [Paenibacillus qinlingensis]MDR6549301.1 AraC-like DNA-binding protein/quercetin dioxygenase-like cupin family protein [Paenibacillus qinlingensis]
MTISETNTTEYRRTHLKMSIVIQKVITMHYFEYGKDFVFDGEKHDFWEFLYVDRGEVEVHADDDRYLLKQGSIIFHKPNEFHSFYATKGKAPNLIVMTFDCHSKAMQFFERKVLHLEDEERNLLAQIVREGQQAFEFPFGHPLVRRLDAPVGSEQMLQSYLEILLLRLLRKSASPEAETPLSTVAKEKSTHDLTSKVMSYMEDHIDTHLTLNEISQVFCVGKTQLKDLFKKHTNYTLMEYFAKLKIDQAKIMIREETYNFTEISRQLGFSSVHYFSKAFKKATLMSPSEYARTVKSRM